MSKYSEDCKGEIALCSDLVMRYRLWVLRANGGKYKKSDGYHTALRYYMYCPSLKKRIGDVYTINTACTKKQIRSSRLEPDGSDPTKKVRRIRLREPSDLVLRGCIKKLLMENTGTLDPTLEKKLKHQDRVLKLNENEMFVFWIGNFPAISALDRRKRSDDERQEHFAALCPYVGGIDLSAFFTTNIAQREAACRELIARARKGHRALKEEMSNSSALYRDVQLLRLAIVAYGAKHGLDSTGADKLLMRLSAPSRWPEDASEQEPDMSAEHPSPAGEVLKDVWSKSCPACCGVGCRTCANGDGVLGRLLASPICRGCSLEKSNWQPRDRFCPNCGRPLTEEAADSFLAKLAI